MLTRLYPTQQLSAAQVESPLYFVARLIFCVNLDHWLPDQNLREHLESVFIASTSEDKCRLPRSFNACTISHITDINVGWSDDLNHHLEVTENDGDLVLFNSASIVELFQKSSTAQLLFPDGLLEETADSISLFCPRGAADVNAWLGREQRRRDANVDQSLQTWCKEYRLRPSGRQVQSFRYWRDNIIVIKEIFDEREPRQVKHWWRDHRRPMQWWTFWIAVTAFFLSLMAVILGAMQVYKSYHPTPEPAYLATT